MIQICSFSSGLSSALMTLRVLEKFGKEVTQIVFLDTLMEDEDNYRFMKDFEERFGVNIIRLSYGLTPYQLFDKKGIVPNSRLAPCTFYLKINLFKRYLKELMSTDPDITVNIGYDFKEVHRCQKTKENYEAMGVKVDFPLLWPPIIQRRYADIFENDYGIKPPRMYAMGYSHANCGGVCVKQGMRDWKITYLNFPERYRQVMLWEKSKGGKYTILKKRFVVDKKTITTPLSLEDFAKNYIDAPFVDGDAYCINCSIGDYSEDELTFILKTDQDVAETATKPPETP